MGAKTARLYVFLLMCLCLQSLFHQNKMSVSFREIARLIARNSLKLSAVAIYRWRFMCTMKSWALNK